MSKLYFRQRNNLFTEDSEIKSLQSKLDDLLTVDKMEIEEGKCYQFASGWDKECYLKYFGDNSGLVIEEIDGYEMIYTIYRTKHLDTYLSKWYHEFSEITEQQFQKILNKVKDSITICN